jgi:regulatory protein
MQKKSKKTGIERLKNYALRLIVKKRYTVSEMTKKLERFVKKHKLENNEGSEEGDSHPHSNIEKVLDRLFELNYLNDKAFARDYIMDRVRFRPRGKFLLRRELFLKGIDKEIVENIINETEIDEAKMAEELIVRQSKRLEKLPPQKCREKIYRYLASRGFSQDSIYKTIESYYN